MDIRSGGMLLASVGLAPRIEQIAPEDLGGGQGVTDRVAGPVVLSAK